MKAFIVGAAGFVGGYLIEHLHSSCKYSIGVSKLKREEIYNQDVVVYDLDILQEEDVFKRLNNYRPDYIFHLAAQSSVALSWTNPTLTVDVNIKGTLNVLNAIRRLDYKPRVLLIGSGEEYGHVEERECPIDEETTLRPGNIYAATKACQGMIGKIYSDAYNMDIMMVRAFNHIGPRQSPVFVVADFCKQVALIEKGKQEPTIKVGNLSAKRDFIDVRDVVHAYALLMKKGKAGEFYNVGSGDAVEISEILNMILKQSNMDISVLIDNKKFRPVDTPKIVANISKLISDTGWNQKYSLENVIIETLAYWRGTV